MKWNKCIIFSVILFVVAVGFSVIKLQEATYITNQYSSVSVRLKTKGVTTEFIQNALHNWTNNLHGDSFEITAWAQRGESIITNSDLKRKAKVWVNMVSGDVSLTAPMELQSGSLVYQGDYQGCVIDTDTAFQLYGTVNAVGNSLNYHGRDYCVRGVIKATGRLMLYQSKDTSILYPNLEMVHHNKEQGEMLTEEFLLQNGFPSNYVIVDGCIYGKLIKTIEILPIWMFFGVVCFLAFIYLYRIRHELNVKRYTLYNTILILIMTGYGIILYRLTGSPLYLPEKYIPTKFSDFDFWGKQYTLIMKQLQQLRYLTPNLKDVNFENAMLRLPFHFIIMILLYIIFLLYLRSSIKELNKK